LLYNFYSLDLKALAVPDSMMDDSKHYTGPVIPAHYFLCTVCPSTFSRISSGCYKLLTRTVNWADAAQECRSAHRDAHLVVISDAQEHLAVAAWLSQFPYSVFLSAALGPS